MLHFNVDFRFGKRAEKCLMLECVCVWVWVGGSVGVCVHRCTDKPNAMFSLSGHSVCHTDNACLILHMLP